ncbi:MAG: FAD-dependent oxidoreductase [Ilumatobacteraceae bacterium]
MNTVDGTDVVVIGGGIMGCSIALELARIGRSPVVLDKGPGPGAGSTSASSAIIRFNYSTPDAVKLSWESAQMWKQWRDHLGVTDELGTAKFVRTGLLVLDSPATPLSTVQALFDDAGVPYEALDPAQLRVRYADLDVGRYFPPKPVEDDAFWADNDGELSAYLTPDAGFIDDPALAAHNLMIAATAAGASFRFRTEVTRVNHVRGEVTGVELADGETLECGIVVNAAGPYSSKVNALAGLHGAAGVTTRPLRQEVDVLPAPPGFMVGGGGVIVTDADLGTYFRPHLGGTLIAGGVEPDCDRLEWIDDPDNFNEMPTVAVWEAQTTRVARRLPTVGIPVRPTGIAALYDVSSDWLPIYDRSDLDGFYLAIGTSGNQFKNAPMVGPIMVAIIEACEAGHDHDGAPITIGCPLTGNTLDAAAFSRRRRVQATTNSVLG